MPVSPGGYALGGIVSDDDPRDHPFDRHPHAAMLASGPVLPQEADASALLGPAWDQSYLGSCEGHGCPAAALAIHRRIVPSFMPSRLAAYAWGRAKDGTPLYVDGGVQTRSMLKVLVDGLYDEQVWPYDPTKFAVAPPGEQRAFKISGYTEIATNEQLMAHVAQGGCAPFSMRLPDYFEGLGPMGIQSFMKPYAGEKIIGAHCLCAVAYRIINNVLWLKCRNSWGPAWGDSGHAWIMADTVLGDLGGDCWALYAANNM